MRRSILPLVAVGSAIVCGIVLVVAADAEPPTRDVARTAMVVLWLAAVAAALGARHTRR